MIDERGELDVAEWGEGGFALGLAHTGNLALPPTTVRTERSRSACCGRGACVTSFDFAQDERFVGFAGRRLLSWRVGRLGIGLRLLRIRVPDRVVAVGDLRHRAAGGDAGQRHVDQRARGARLGILDLAEQPVLALLARPRLHADEQPLALHPLAVQDDVDVAVLDRFDRVLAADRFPLALVPQHDGAAAIFPRRDRPLERRVGHRMVFGAHREPFVVGIGAGTARHRPAFEHAVHLEPEIPVQAGGVVLLDHEEMARLDAALALGLARLLEIALGVVGRERVGFRALRHSLTRSH